MKKRLSIIALLVFTVAYFGSLNLIVYAEDDEAILKAQVKELCEKWNKQDASLMDVWKADAKIMYGLDKTVTDKAGYMKVLDSRMKALKANPNNPVKVKIKDANNALVRVDIYDTGNPITIKAVKENGKWMWTEWSF
jgi:hypothetical protein